MLACHAGEEPVPHSGKASVLFKRLIAKRKTGCYHSFTAVQRPFLRQDDKPDTFCSAVSITYVEILCVLCPEFTLTKEGAGRGHLDIKKIYLKLIIISLMYLLLLRHFLT